MFQNRPRQWPLSHTTPLPHVRRSRKVSPVFASSKVPRQNAGPATDEEFFLNCSPVSSAPSSGSGKTSQPLSICHALPFFASNRTGPRSPFRSNCPGPKKFGRPIASTNKSKLTVFVCAGKSTLTSSRSPGCLRRSNTAPICFPSRKHQPKSCGANKCNTAVWCDT